MASITQLKRVHFRATVIYFLIDTGTAYENTVAVPFVPAGFVRLPGLPQAQGAPGCHMPAGRMLRGKGEGKGLLLGVTASAKGKNITSSIPHSSGLGFGR